MEACLFNQSQARLAELWILKGDWQYKGKEARLELADFFPPEEKIKYLIEMAGLKVMQSEVFASAIRKAREEGRQSVMLAEKTEPLPIDFAALVNENVQLKHDLHEALERNATQAQTIERIMRRTEL